jgi:hypothetical protein
MSIIGMEVAQAVYWKKKGDYKRVCNFCKIAIELLIITEEDPRNSRCAVEELNNAVEELRDYFLGNNIYETTDKRYRYLVRVDQFIDAGNKRPLEQVRDIIRQMIIRQRAQNELKFLEDSLMQSAMKEGVIFVNQTIDKQTKK